MDRSRNLILLTALLTGIAGLAGVARAELIEPDAPIQQSSQAHRLVPLPMPRPGPHAAAVHRPSPARAVAVMAPRPQLRCGWFECSQYVIVGIGF